LEAIRYFSDPDVALAFVAKLRWTDGQPVCPSCQGTEHSFLTTRRIWKCRACKRQFSVKVGTIFEDSPIGFDKWLPALWLIANSKNGISSHELGRALDVCQKTAWFMLHRIRLAMQSGSFRKLDGVVEGDETYIGGKVRNMHTKVRKARGIGVGPSHGKAIVAGLVERGGDVRALPVPDVTHDTLVGNIWNNVEPGATIYTDELVAYNGVDQFYAHKSVTHTREYVVGDVHINTLESFWALLKRSISGTYVSVNPEHLHRYIDERTFAYNYRKLSDLGRMHLALGGVSDRRLTWNQLTGQDAA